MNLKLLSCAILVLMVLLVPQTTNAAELITNGSFESGMTGWTINNATGPAIPWQAVTAGFTNGPLAPTQPQMGSFDAFQGVTGNAGTRFITQDFTIPAGSTASVHWRHRFQLDLLNFCDPPNCGTGLYTVDILNTSNLLLTSLYARSVASDQSIDTGWQTFQRNLSAFAGLTVRLRFRTTTTANNPGPGQLEIDGVSVQAPGLVPTAANVSVGGRVLNGAGSGISRVTVTLTDNSGNVLSAITNPFGYYNFEEVRAGQTYVLDVSDKRYSFADSPRVVNVHDSMANIDFIASP